MVNKRIVVTLSGGMDSAVLLHKAATEAEEVFTVTFDYGQRHSRELDRILDQLFNAKKHFDNVKFYNTRLDAKTVAYIIDHSEAKVLIVDRQLHSVIELSLIHI